MDTVTYPDPRVARFVEEDCIPVRVAVKENPDLVDEYLVGWTPNVVIADGRGRVHDRVEGYLPPREFVARLSLGVGKFLLNEKRFVEAVGRFEGVVSRHPGSAPAAEALYWLGVARYKEAKDPAQLRPSWERPVRDYPDSEWTTRTKIPGQS